MTIYIVLIKSIFNQIPDHKSSYIHYKLLIFEKGKYSSWCNSCSCLLKVPQNKDFILRSFYLHSGIVNIFRWWIYNSMGGGCALVRLLETNTWIMKVLLLWVSLMCEVRHCGLRCSITRSRRPRLRFGQEKCRLKKCYQYFSVINNTQFLGKES